MVSGENPTVNQLLIDKNEQSIPQPLYLDQPVVNSIASVYQSKRIKDAARKSVSSARLRKGGGIAFMNIQFLFQLMFNAWVLGAEGKNWGCPYIFAYCIKGKQMLSMNLVDPA